LFFANRTPRLAVLERYIGRLGEFREALAAGDRDRMHRSLEASVAAKSAFGKGLK
jgi:hypothetical protein